MKKWVLVKGVNGRASLHCMQLVDAAKGEPISDFSRALEESEKIDGKLVSEYALGVHELHSLPSIS